MKKILIYSAGFVLLFVYFLLTVFILPSEFLMTEQLIPQPIFEAILSETEIKLGDSFRLDIVSKNIGDYADIHIVSCLLYTSPSPRDGLLSRMPSSA